MTHCELYKFVVKKTNTPVAKMLTLILQSILIFKI